MVEVLVRWPEEVEAHSNLAADMAEVSLVDMEHREEVAIAADLEEEVQEVMLLTKHQSLLRRLFKRPTTNTCLEVTST